ncbi:MAG: elongation factor Ts [Candidatus Omnitrophica bacterium]|nr:elongation factor Ts [Candidatus Omnitrophota bacterium]
MSLSDIKKLREMTSLGINECKKALAESKGDFDKALQILKDKGAAVLAKKSSRSASQGLIDSYVHFGGNLGALVEVNCETDFVARTDVFKKFVKDVAMQVAAASPEYISKDDIPADVLQSNESPDDFMKQHCLIEQPFIKDNKMTIGDYLREVVSQSGENIVIRRFVRFGVGE